VQVRNEARLAGRRVKGHHRILVIRPVLAMIGSVRSNVQVGGRRPANMNLGFANGNSGSERATLAVVQARRFRAEQLLAGPVVNVSADGPGYVTELSDGTSIRGQALLLVGGDSSERVQLPADALRTRSRGSGTPSEPESSCSRRDGTGSVRRRCPSPPQHGAAAGG
jgi:hypothetical protein